MKRLAILALTLLPAPALAQAKPPSSAFNNLTVDGVATFTKVSPPNIAVAGTYNPPAVMAGAGNAIWFCPQLSCVRGPYDGSVNPLYFGTQRASLLVSGKTQADGSAQEQLLAVIGTSDTGRTTPWTANTTYAVGDNVDVVNPNESGAVYRVKTAGTTGNVAPPATRPNSLPFTYTDGTVVWEWINDPVLSAKANIYNEQTVRKGSANSWGQATNVYLAPGLVPKFHVNTEFDFGNDSGTDCGFGNGNCYNLFVRSGGANKLTSQVEIGSVPTGPWSAYFGLRVAGPRTAQYGDIVTDSSGDVGVGVCSTGIDVCTHARASIFDQSISPVGLQFKQGAPNTTMHSVATIVDDTTTPTFASIAGTKTFAGIFEHSTTPVGLMMSGSYGLYSIQANGFTVSPTGFTTVNGINMGTGTPASSTAACNTGDFRFDGAFIYACTGPNQWKRAALASW